MLCKIGEYVILLEIILTMCVFHRISFIKRSIQLNIIIIIIIIITLSHLIRYKYNVD